MNSGIYKITNTKTGMVYIGAASSLRKRKTAHFRLLKQDTHHNRYLQNSYNKNGKEAFVFEVLEYCDTNILSQREQHFIDTYDASDKAKGFNIAAVSYSCLGIKRGYYIPVRPRSKKIKTIKL